MHILLLILKIIGIVLLCMIGLVLLVILTVIFVPFRYGLKGGWHESYYLYARFSWILHLIHVTAEFFDKTLHIRIRIAGIPIIKKEKQLFGKSQDAAESSESPDITEEFDPAGTEPGIADGISSDEVTGSDWADNGSANSGQMEDISVQAEFAAGSEAVNEQEQELLGLIDELGDSVEISDQELQKLLSGEASDSDQQEETREKTPEERAAEIQEKIEYTIDAIYDKIYQMEDKVDGAVEKADQARRKAENILWFITSAKFQRALRTGRKEIIAILKSIRPRKFSLDLAFGFEDPSLTGMLMGFLSYLSGVLPGKYVLDPDFHEKKIEGDIALRGYIMLILIIVPCVKLLLNKDVRACIKMVRKLK